VALLWGERDAFVGLFWTGQTAGPVDSRKFHRSMAALVLLVVVAQTVFILFYRLKISH
jgi:hypothetical protein